MSRQSRFVLVAQVIIIPLWVVLAVATGIWWFTHGHKSQAAVMFALAAVSVISIPVYHLLQIIVSRLNRRRVNVETMSLRVDGPTALRWTAEALQMLTPDAEPEVDAEQLIASIEIPRSWRTWGERVIAVIHAHDGDSTVDVTSHCVVHQLVDYGKNRANVEAVIQTLASFQMEER
jgi:hypothetical protein